MKIRFQAKLTAVIRRSLYLIIHITSGYAIAQSVTDENSFELPAINYNLEINFDNLFQSSYVRPESYQLNSDKPDRASFKPMQLVGTIIMGENKLALIKTGEYQFHMLKRGQIVPGSELRIDHILTDTVELVNTDNCYENSVCTAQLVLELK